jgi:hypothetical protein
MLAVVVTVGAFRAHNDEAFNRWVGWATIWALVVAVIGVLLVVWDKVFPTDDDAVNVAETQRQLAKIVLAEAVDLRSRLIGAGEVSDEPVNVRFAKSRSRFREVGGARSGDLRTVLAYYLSLSPERLVILGDPGAGKTVLAIELQILLLEERERDGVRPIPVLISAAAYDTRQAWQQWLIGHLVLRFSISKAAAARLVIESRILPVVDGLDEMDTSDPGQVTRMGALVAALNAALQGRHRAPVVVTCRRTEYASLERGIVRATHVEMVPLDGDEAADYLREQFLNEDEEHRWAPVLTSLHADPTGPMAIRLATPWRLTLALAAFRDAGEPMTLLAAAPGAPAEAPGAALTAVDHQLLGQYIANAVRLHDKAGRYQLGDVRRWLSALSGGLAQQADRGGSVTDIELATWWTPTAGKAAPLVHSLPMLALGVAALAGALTAELDFGWTRALPYAAVAVIPFVLGAMAARSPVPKRVRARQVVTLKGARVIARGLAFGLGLGLFLGLSLGISDYFGFVNSQNGYAPIVSPGAFVLEGCALGLGAGLVVGVVAGLAGGLSDATPQPIGPRDVIKADRSYLVAFESVLMPVLGLAFGVVAGVLQGYSQAAMWPGFWPASWTEFWTGFWSVSGLSALVGITVAFVFGLSFWVAGVGGRGSSAWTRYHIAVVINWMRGRAPLRFGAFLDWAHDAGLLRVSGVAYQFRHRQLQEWLTSTVNAEKVVLAPALADGAMISACDIAGIPPSP